MLKRVNPVNNHSMKLASLSNLIARSFIVFIISYLWLTFYIRSLLTVFLLAFGIMLAVNLLFRFFARKRNARAVLNKQQREHVAQIALQLKFQGRTKTLKLLREALDKTNMGYRNVTATQRKLVIQNADKKVNLFPLFNVEPTIKDIIECLKSTNKGAETYICATNFSPEVIGFANSLDASVTLMDVASVYTEILLPAETYPEVVIEMKSKAKLTWSQLRCMVFNRRKVKTYVFLGFIILATSFIVRFNIYYIVVATILFSFALLSMFVLPSKRDNLFAW